MTFLRVREKERERNKTKVVDHGVGKIDPRIPDHTIHILIMCDYFKRVIFKRGVISFIQGCLFFFYKREDSRNDDDDDDGGYG